MIKNKYPTIKPSLNLDFENTKSLDPRVTFRRGTPGTYYDGVTHVKAEENLVKHSYAPGIVGDNWSLVNMVANADVAVAPDGDFTAFRMSPTTGGTTAAVSTGVSKTEQSYTWSIYAKMEHADYPMIALYWNSSGAASVVFDLSTGTVLHTKNGNGVMSNQTITHVGDGWYRCSCTYTGATSPSAVMYVLDSSATFGDGGWNFALNNSPADGLAGLLVWGPQVEVRDFVTPYTETPNDGSTVTRYQPQLMTASPDDARFDHDPLTGESKGLLIEEQRVNLHRRSEDFSTTDHINFSGDMFANQMIAPDGQLTATSVMMDDGATSGGWSTMYRPAATAGVEYTFSIHIKPGDFSKFEFGLNARLNTLGDNGASAFVYNFDTHTVEQTLTYGDAPEPTSHTVQSIGNGWYRATISAVMPANTAFLNTYVYIEDTVAGVGNNTYYVWGSQLEQGGFATSYIKTTGASATRSADNASIVGENFSSWYRQDEGSLYVDSAKGNLGTSFAGYVSLHTEDFSNSEYYWLLHNDSDQFQFLVAPGIASLADEIDVSLSSQKACVSWADNNFYMSVNGNTIQSDTDGPAKKNLAGLRIGFSPYSNSHYLNSHIKKLAYYPQRLTNEQLQNLTR